MERFLIDDGIKQLKIVANRYKWSIENADMGSEDANELNADIRNQYVKEYEQIAEWLEELKSYKDIGTLKELKELKENGAFTGLELAKLAIMQKELKKYKDLEEQGLLVRFPCPIGTTVWDIYGMGIRKNVVSGIEYGKDGRWFLWANEDEWQEKYLKEAWACDSGAKTLAGLITGIKIDKGIITESIQHYGKNNQSTVCMEECAELIQAISKAKRGKINRDNMIEEIADVLICIEMLKQMYMISDEKINKWIEKKQAREVKRISQKELL